MKKRVPLWNYRKNSLPTCAVMRHAERADSDRWENHTASSLDFRLNNFPFDPVLSSFGEQQAEETSTKLLDAAAQGTHRATKSSDSSGGSVFGIVVSSPYMRCVQTAAHVCRAAKLPLLLDNALGEVYSLEIMGDNEPDCVLRSHEEAARYCATLGVELRSNIVGQWPKWPETLGEARVRYVHRFLQYLRRSEVTRRNFILVTHAHGVSAMLSTMPAMQARSIKHVDLAGYFLARAAFSCNRSGCESIDTTQDVGDDEAQGTHLWAQNWEVVWSKVKVGRCTDESLMTRIKRWAGKSRSRYSEHQINTLLHFSPNSASEASMTSTENDQDSDAFSDTGISTLCFGDSQAGSPSTNLFSALDVSPTHSPSKSFVQSAKSLLESGTQYMQTCSGRGSHSPEKLYHSPEKLYGEVGVSPVHTPPKVYEPPTLRKRVSVSVVSDIGLAVQSKAGEEMQKFIVSI